MESPESGRPVRGLGEIQPTELPAFEVRYRFFFNPIRYASLGLAVVEALMLGIPIIGLATTEMVTVVENGVSGYLDTSVEQLTAHMRDLPRRLASLRTEVSWPAPHLPSVAQ
jgi:glycosyltransferase involved in cell wall biosynthesis